MATSATPNPHFIPNWWNPRHGAEAARNQWSQRNQLKPQLEWVKDQKILVSKKNIQKDQKNIIGIQKITPEKPIPSSTSERTTFPTIAHQFLSSPTQMLIPMRRSPGCYCTYVGLSALMCGCMHVRTCACMSV